MFRAHRAHNQERPIALIQLLVTVTLFYFVPFSYPLNSSHSHKQGKLDITSNVSHTNKTLNFAMQNKRYNFTKYKNIKTKLYKNNAAIWYNKTCRLKQITPRYIKLERICASSWLLTKNHCMMHGQQNVKFWLQVNYGVIRVRMWFGDTGGQDSREEKMDGSCSRPGSITALFSCLIPVILISHVTCNMLIKSYRIITLINFRINLQMELACFSVKFVSACNTARCQNSKIHYEHTIINDMVVTSCKKFHHQKMKLG